MILAAVTALAVGVVLGIIITRWQLRSRPEQVARRDATDANTDTTLRATLDAVSFGVVVADRQGRVVFRNPIADRYGTGRPTGTLVGAAVDDTIRDLGQNGTVERELDLYGPPRLQLILRGARIVDGGETTGSLVTLEDVTDVRRVDSVRRDFVANVSHELKTPAGAIGVLAETLAEEDDPEVTHRLAERLQSEAMRLGETIDDLLALAQLEASGAVELEPVPVSAVIEAAEERTAASAELRDVAIRVDVDNPRLTVAGDRRQLVLAATNLIDNGVKYSDPGATVTVRAFSHDDQVVVEVADRGPGIPEGDLERVFERFYRVDRARSRDTGGTGLGLAIVRHVALNHAGDVTVTSREGHGSVFTLRLPRWVETPAGAPTASTEERTHA